MIVHGSRVYPGTRGKKLVLPDWVSPPPPWEWKSVEVEEILSVTAPVGQALSAPPTTQGHCSCVHLIAKRAELESDGVQDPAPPWPPDRRFALPGFSLSPVPGPDPNPSVAARGPQTKSNLGELWIPNRPSQRL